MGLKKTDPDYGKALWIAGQTGIPRSTVRRYLAGTLTRPALHAATAITDAEKRWKRERAKASSKVAGKKKRHGHGKGVRT